MSSPLFTAFDIEVTTLVLIPHILPPSAITIAIAITIMISYREALDSLKPKKWSARNAPPPFHQFRVFAANIENTVFHICISGDTGNVIFTVGESKCTLIGTEVG
jgi:hypothetical protein